MPRYQRMRTIDLWPHDVDDTEKGENYAAALDKLYRRHRARPAGRHVYADDGFGTLLLLQASSPPPPPSSLLVASSSPALSLVVLALGAGLSVSAIELP
jgi:hypothetical protein